MTLWPMATPNGLARLPSALASRPVGATCRVASATAAAAVGGGIGRPAAGRRAGAVNVSSQAVPSHGR
jgi:hypothetical protein